MAVAGSGHAACAAASAGAPPGAPPAAAAISVVTLSALLPGFRSIVPSFSGATRAVFVTVPARPAVPVIVMTARLDRPPLTVTVSETALPLPPAEPQAAWPAEAQVQATSVMASGTVSVTRAWKASSGPALVTVRV